MVLGLLSAGNAFAQSQAQTQTQTQATAQPATDAKVVSQKDAQKDTKTKKAQAEAATQQKAAADANATGDTTSITVTAQKPLNRIDRQVYDNTKDPDSKTGTALDAMAKLPGVSVDPNGKVLLRGKEPEILINGRPAPQLQSGDNRAAALQGMSSGSITSMEVMNNPGAQYSTGSSSGIINLITTAVQPPGGFVSASLQSTGGYSLNLNGHTQFGKLSLNGSLGTSDIKNDTLSGSARQSLDSSGNVLRSNESNGHSTGDGLNTNLFASADYRLDAKNTLSAGLSYFNYDGTNQNDNHNATYNTAGVATDIYTSAGQSKTQFERQTASVTWSHNGAKPGETLKIDWRGTQGDNNSTFSSLSQYSLSTIPSNLAGYRTSSKNTSRSGNSTFSIDYNVPIGDDQLTTGLQIRSDTNNSKSQFTAPNTVTTLSSSEYDYDQTISAFYATYQKPFGDHWTVLGGLRVEVFELDGRAPIVGLSNHVTSTSYNPSLFATYIISEKAKFRLSYSHNLQRPFATDFNPQTYQTSATSISVGQGRLKPQETNSFETGYEYSDKGTSYQLRGYYTAETGIIIYVSTFIPDPLNLGNLVLRTSRQNAGTRDTLASEFNLNTKLTPKLSVSLNATLSSVSLDSPNFKDTKSVGGLSGRVGLNYQLDTKNRFYLTYNISPKVLDTQGYRTGYGQVGFQYYRKLTPTTQLSLAFNDVARSSKTKNFYTTPTYVGYNFYSRQAPTVYLTLSRSFGITPAAISTSRPTVGSSSVGAASPGGGGGNTNIIIR